MFKNFYIGYSMPNPPYTPPWPARNGLAMTLYTALLASRRWERTIVETEPLYQAKIFAGANNVPIFGWVAIPENPRGTIVGTYGITGSLDNQWFLRVLGRKAFARGYAVVLFDWRAHGKTAELSPTLTSDGLYEGEDFVRIAAEAKMMGCPAPFWFTGYSLGGQLALWAVKAAGQLLDQDGIVGSAASKLEKVKSQGNYAELTFDDIAGGAVICPSLDSNRSLSYLVKDPLGRYLEKAIARELKKLAWRVHEAHPEAIDPNAIARANSIWGFDHELVIKPLGFPSVEAYYEASSALHILPHLQKPTLILYAADDPIFDPSLVPDLQAACAGNSYLDLMLTRYGGHVGYISNKACQQKVGDSDPWWAWNRILDWWERGR